MCAFLDIAEDAVTDGLDKPVNEGLKADLPIYLRHYLFDQYADEMHEMADKGVAYAKAWLDEHNEIVRRESSK